MRGSTQIAASYLYAWREEYALREKNDSGAANAASKVNVITSESQTGDTRILKYSGPSLHGHACRSL